MRSLRTCRDSSRAEYQQSPSVTRRRKGARVHLCAIAAARAVDIRLLLVAAGGLHKAQRVQRIPPPPATRLVLLHEFSARAPARELTNDAGRAQAMRSAVSSLCY